MLQTELARLAGISDGHLSCLIKGINALSWAKAVRMAKVANKANPGLNCTPTLIMENIGKGDKLRKVLGIDIRPKPKTKPKRKEAAA